MDSGRERGIRFAGNFLKWSADVSTILIVDHLSEDRSFMVALLRAEGHRLLEAADGIEGLAVVRAQIPDLVIADVVMPLLDGYEFVKQLRLDPETRGIPVLFYSAPYAERKARSFTLARPPDPLTADQEQQLETVRVSAKHLLSLVNDLLSQKPGHRQGAGNGDDPGR